MANVLLRTGREIEYERLQRKADECLKQGDAISKTDQAESKRLLRQCRRYRRKAAELCE